MLTPADNSAARPGLARGIIALFLGGILVALVFLVGLLAFQSGGSRPSGKGGKTVEAIGDLDRIKEVLRPGKTYQVILQAGIEARVEDKQYTIKTVTNMVYTGEFVIRRKIERNDGKEVVEVRTFDSCRTVKAESHVEDLKLDWGTSGDLLLASLEFVEPGLGVLAVQSKAVIESLMRGAAQNIVAANVESWQKTDSLSGKSVRITYRDGEGVVSLEPIDGNLSADEEAFLYNLALLSDHYLFPEADVKPGATWEVDAYQLSGLLDPSLRGLPTGNVVIRRGSRDQLQDGRELAELTIERGYVELDSSDEATSRIGSFVPRGTLLFNTSDGFLQQADLTGDVKFDQVSKDHLLFETTFRTSPKFLIRYRCQMVE